MTDIPTVAAIVFAVVTSAVVMFQVALVAGAPWGEMALAGKYPGVLPPHIRIVEVIQIMLLDAMMVVVLCRAGLILPDFRPLTDELIWVAAAISSVSFILNTITPSRKERMLWSPAALLMAITSLTVALMT